MKKLLVASTTTLISTVVGVRNVGRMYRPLFCESCGDVRYHTIDFVSGERSGAGIFVWFNRRCTGVEAHDSAKHRKPRLIKDCGKEAITDMPLLQWETFVEGKYY